MVVVVAVDVDDGCGGGPDSGSGGIFKWTTNNLGDQDLLTKTYIEVFNYKPTYYFLCGTLLGISNLLLQVT